MTFYERVSGLCTSHGITVNGLIVKLGMSKSNGKNWRNGAVPQAATLKKIADYFEVSPVYLLNGNETKAAMGDVSDNHGVIGDVHAGSVSITSAPAAPENGMLKTLCDIFSHLDTIDKARLLLYANDLLQASQKAAK